MFCDIHTHYIPDVDDGCRDLEMARILLQQSLEQGTGVVFATPHSEAFLTDHRKVMKKYHDLQTLVQGVQLRGGVLRRDFLGLKLRLGCEVRCEEAEMETVLYSLRTGLFPSMNGTHCVLTEFPRWVSPGEALNCLRLLLTAGWIPIIAHAERYEQLRDVEFFRKVRGMDCLIQVNVYSLEEPGFARTLASEGLTDFLASDAHSIFFRPPSIRQGLSWLRDHVPPEMYLALTEENAKKYLEIF